jgi:prepilin-type N-terminal cleavage/methylation domain-containing protein
MTTVQKPIRRGLTLVELLMALAVTALVAASISSMLGAVTQGISVRRDTRSLMVMANAAQTRLASYLVPAHCILAASETSVVVWFNDATESETVHATEIRWISFDAGAGELVVEYVQFPSNWTKVMCDLADEECAVTDDWAQVKQGFSDKGYLARVPLLDRVDSAQIELDAAATAARHVTFRLGMDAGGTVEEMDLSATIRIHRAPTE